MVRGPTFSEAAPRSGPSYRGTGTLPGQGQEDVTGESSDLRLQEPRIDCAPETRPTWIPVRFGSIAREAVADVEDAARMATHKFLPGRAVALEALLDQLGILLQASSVLRSTWLLNQDPQVV